jgi:hypothetical protein
MELVTDNHWGTIKCFVEIIRGYDFEGIGSFDNAPRSIPAVEV